MAHHGPIGVVQAVSALETRTQDFSDKVRASVAVALCEVAAKAPLVGLLPIEAAMTGCIEVGLPSSAAM